MDPGSFGGGELCRGIDPLNHISEREFWLVLTVARHREVVLEGGLIRGCLGRQLRAMEGILEALCGADRRKPVAIDISLDLWVEIPKTSDQTLKLGEKLKQIREPSEANKMLSFFPPAGGHSDWRYR